MKGFKMLNRSAMRDFLMVPVTDQVIPKRWVLTCGKGMAPQWFPFFYYTKPTFSNISEFTRTLTTAHLVFIWIYGFQFTSIYIFFYFGLCQFSFIQTNIHLFKRFVFIFIALILFYFSDIHGPFSPSENEKVK